MRRRTFGFLAALVCLTVVASAHAAPKRRGKAKSKREKGAPTSEAIESTMGELKWGMSKEELLTFLATSIKEKYRPLVQKTRDPLEKDRLRHEFRDEVKRLKESFVEFDGRSTGWDVSFLRGEFTHNNGETMLVQRDKNSQNFYLLINGRLWKWYKAFDAAVFPASNFKQFGKKVQRKFGPGKDANGELSAAAGERHWIEWQDKRTRLRAVDQTEFYGFYSLVFEEKETLSELARLRRNKSHSGPKRHSLIEAVTSGDGEEMGDDSNIVDRITGKMRVREKAQDSESSAERGAKRSRKGRNARKEDRPARRTSDRSVSEEDDPLHGIL